MTSAEASLHTGEGSLTFKKGTRKRRSRKRKIKRKIKRKMMIMMEVEEIQSYIKMHSVEEKRLKLIDRITY